LGELDVVAHLAVVEELHLERAVRARALRGARRRELRREAAREVLRRVAHHTLDGVADEGQPPTPLLAVDEVRREAVHEALVALLLPPERALGAMPLERLALQLLHEDEERGPEEDEEALDGERDADELAAHV